MLQMAGAGDRKSAASGYVPSVSEYRIKLPNGLSLAIKDWGNASSPRKVLCLHGFLDNANTFDRLLPLLQSAAPDLAHFVALDCAGHGLSSHRSADALYNRVTYTLDCLGVVDALGWSTFSVMGHSMGANLATSIASIVPDRVTSIVLLDGVAHLASILDPTIQIRAVYEQLNRLTSRKPRVHPSLQAITEHYCLSLGNLIAPESARLIVQRGSTPTAIPVPAAGSGAAAAASAAKKARASPATAATAISAAAAADKKQYSAGGTGYAFSHDPRLAISPSPTFIHRSEVDSILAHVICPALCMLVSNPSRVEELSQPYKPGEWNFVKTLWSYTDQLTNKTMHIVDGGEHHAHMDMPERYVAPLIAWYSDADKWKVPTPKSAADNDAATAGSENRKPLPTDTAPPRSKL